MKRHPGRRLIHWAGATLLVLGIQPAQALVPVGEIAQVASGGTHTCALTTTGTVKCWGRNSEGQLGDGTTTMRPTPVEVTALGSGVTAITAGGRHTCALLSTGGVKCWGFNESGQLGDNSTTQRLVPVNVAGLASGVAAVSAGVAHTCALMATGAVKCWGNGLSGQLGDGWSLNRLAPVDVVGPSGVGMLAGVQAISAGSAHTCALTSAGGAVCWGANNKGQLGEGSTVLTRVFPVNVSGLASGVGAIEAGGSHSCAVTTTGAMKCWGSNWGGLLGDGTLDQRNAPVDVVGLGSGVSAISTGRQHTCALTSAGAVKCWGDSQYAQVGDDSYTYRATPVDVLGLAGGVAAISAGDDHTCALTAGGGLKCWGDNPFGQLGDGSWDFRPSVGDVAGLSSGVAAIGAGGYHTCAVTSDGAAKCWGRNALGQVGDGTTTNRLAPVAVSGLGAGVDAVAAGSDHSCALTSTGGVQCWGFNGSGQLGDGTTTLRPVPADVTGLSSGVSAIGTGDAHACALTSGGGVKCWGFVNFSVRNLVPVDVPGPGGIGVLSGIQAIAAGGYHSCALSSAGGVKCWGENTYGQLGDDSTWSTALTPVDVSGLAAGVSAIAAGQYHSCALTAAGGVKCWGRNDGGQLGDGTTTQRLAPVDVTGLSSGVIAIAAGGHHTCALTAAGGVKCWGGNGYGTVGDGSTEPLRTTPVDVVGLSSGATAISAGNLHSCALTSTGGMKCWGYNRYGQLGDGRGGMRPYPAEVLGPAPQAIAFAALPGRTFGDAPFTVGATGGGSGNPVAFSSLTPATCTTSGSDGTTVTIVMPGTCTIQSTQAGGGDWEAASPVSQGFTIAKAAPVVAVASSANPSVPGDAVSFTVTVTGVAGRAPSGTATLLRYGNAIGSAPLAAGASDATASIPGTFQAGTYVIAAQYGGDAYYLAAGSPVISQVAQGAASTDTDGDGIPDAVEAAEGRDALVKDNDVFASTRLFTMQLYRDFLGREGDAGGIQGWTAFIDSGTYTRLTAIDAFLRSQEFAGTMAPVVRLYFATYLRVPDYLGLDFNAWLVRSGSLTLAQLADFFAASPEFTAMYGSLDDAQFVTLLYNNVLGRAPDAAGLSGWVGLLQSGYTRGQVLLGFSDSPEYQAAMANEVFVTMMYAGMLRRTPDAAGFSGWVSMLDAGTATRLQVIDGFYASPEYRSRFLP